MLPVKANAGSRFAVVGLLSLTFAFWLLIHPYRGLEHDSVLYTVLALARLHPAALGHDLFVRFGTQDHFTVFSPMYAAAIRQLGLEPAAAVMTLATYAAFFAAVWALARRLMPAAEGLLAVGLLVVLPSWYGSNSVFAYLEAFLTPRQSAEAFALAGVACLLHSRYLLAAVCLTIGLLLHPIIAAAAVTLCIVLSWGIPHPRRALPITGVLATLLLGLSALGKGPFAHFDAAWLEILQHRLAYLFPTLWTATEWINTSIWAAVLVVGARFSSSAVIRKLCLAVLITVGLGLVFAVVGSDLLHVIIAAQLQTWRWLWLLGVIAVLLIPPIALDCWRAGPTSRAAGVLLLSAWLTRSDQFAALPVALACVLAIAPPRFNDPRHARLVVLGSYALLAVSVIVLAGDVRNTLPQLHTIRTGRRPYLVRIGEAQALCFGGVVPAVALALVWLAITQATRRSAILLAGLGLVLLLSVLPYGVETWLHERYPPSRYQAFAPWRAVIPESAEVLWPDPPPATWFELGRSSYWSLYQMAGMVFSRDVTMASTRRESMVTPVLPLLGRALTATKHYSLAPSREGGADHSASPCQLPGVTFFASWVDLGPTPYPTVSPDIENLHETLYLYRCADNAS